MACILTTGAVGLAVMVTGLPPTGTARAFGDDGGFELDDREEASRSGSGLRGLELVAAAFRFGTGGGGMSTSSSSSLSGVVVAIDTARDREPGKKKDAALSSELLEPDAEDWDWDSSLAKTEGFLFLVDAGRSLSFPLDELPGRPTLPMANSLRCFGPTRKDTRRRLGSAKTALIFSSVFSFTRLRMPPNCSSGRLIRRSTMAVDSVEGTVDGGGLVRCLRGWPAVEGALQDRSVSKNGLELHMLGVGWELRLGCQVLAGQSVLAFHR
ncbi:hypothetical protein C8F01DRAFT_1136113 [Mycena amicta]|nr:hypothetical protein C8F01DRAFT_1136113 [Mycena amicta]